jgi:LuxR family maltose regulon positive regulatory protein
MVSSGVRERSRRAEHAAGPMFDLATAKLLRPLVRAETVRRSLLIKRLADYGARPVVSVVAPAGYGKTTLLAQWAENNGQAFAWVSVDEKDNDPRVLLTYVADALDAVEPVGGRVFEALASRGSSVPGSVVPRLGSAFASMTTPVALILDDVHLLHDQECRAALSVLADHVPAGSRLVLSGREEPPVRVARLRAEGRILEIGPGELSLTREEASSLLRAAELALGEDEVAELHRRTEGWPAGLYLTALYLREGGSSATAVASFGGDDRWVSDYLESELLARISPQQRVFLTRTAVLERLSGPLCDAVLEQPGSAATLAALARSNLLLVPLDRRGDWYRYHHLFRDMLRAELHRLEPGLMPVLLRRAAAWCVTNHLGEEAMEYAIAAGDVGMAARLFEKLAFVAWWQGRAKTVERWLRWLEDRGGIQERPLVTVLAGLCAVGLGRLAEAERWADVIDSWQYGDAAGPADPFTEAHAALLRAILCRCGVEQMRTDADEAARKLAEANVLEAMVPFWQGMARVLSGDPDGADAFFEEAMSVAEETGQHEMVADALCERSLLAMGRGQWDRAEALAGQARAVMRRAGIGEDVLVWPVQARVALHRGDVPAARRELIRARGPWPELTMAFPHHAVRLRIELIRVYLALDDQAGARTLMREIDDVLRRRPDLGTLLGEAEALRGQLASHRGTGPPGASALTTAELRLLPLLATHLSFPEIAGELFLSRHTVKSQAMSMYRKLGAVSRSQAVARSREAGLLEA